MEGAHARRLLVILAAGLMLAGCMTDETGGRATGETGNAPLAADATSVFDFPTGPAVTVSAGYEPPRDRVASTGGYLPTNGKPTLVFAESIT